MFVSFIQRGDNVKRILFTTFFLIPMIGLVGCEDRYRYPCQDPANWNTEQCKKPYCDGDQTCPEDVSSIKKRPILLQNPPMSTKKPNDCNCR